MSGRRVPSAGGERYDGRREPEVVRTALTQTLIVLRAEREDESERFGA
jgi:hypothetical protein